MKIILMFIAVAWSDGEVTINTTRYPDIEFCKGHAEYMEEWFTERGRIVEVWCEAMIDAAMEGE